jgi:DNA-binding MarR family transcriptional regulator
MKKENLESIVENFLFIWPQLKKNLMQPELLPEIQELSKSHFPMLFALHRTGVQTMSELGKKLFISKPHMTFLVEKLIQQNLVERGTDPHDRRIITIGLTDEGNKLVQELLGTIRKNMKENLAVLGDDDLQKLFESLENIKEIITKLNLVK